MILREILRGMIKPQLMLGVVKEVDGQTVTIQPQDGTADIFARLTPYDAGVGLYAVPAVGSVVLVAQPDLVNDWQVVGFQEVTLVVLGDSVEPAVLGDTLNERLAEIWSAIKSIQNSLQQLGVTTAAAAAPVPLTPLAAGFTNLAAEMTTQAVDATANANKLSQHLSEIVSLK